MGDRRGMLLVCLFAGGALLLAGCGGKRDSGPATEPGSVAREPVVADTALPHPGPAEAKPDAAETAGASPSGDAPAATAEPAEEGRTNDRSPSVQASTSKPAPPAKDAPVARARTGGSGTITAARAEPHESAAPSDPGTGAQDTPAAVVGAPGGADDGVQRDAVVVPEQDGQPKDAKDEDCGPAG